MHRAWGTKDGLPQNTVLAMLQTRDGYLWMATQEGLARFDGVTMKQFNKRNTPCLEDHWITKMVQMPGGSVWLLPFHGRPVQLAKGDFRCDPMPAGVPSQSITAIEPAAGGGTWFAASGEGLFLVHGDHIVRVYRGVGHDRLTSVRFRDLTLARDGTLWVSTDGGGVNHIDNTGAVRAFDTASGLASDVVSEVVEARDGTIWVATSHGVDRIVRGQVEHVGVVPSVVVHALTEDSRGTMWFGTENGLFRLRGGRVDAYTEQDGLSGRIATSLLEDREGDLWVGAFMGVDFGVERFSDGLFTPYATAEGLENAQVWSVLEDAPGRVWIGTESGGLSRLENDVMTTFGRSELGDDSVRSLYRGRDGTLWVGTYRAGTRRMRGAAFEPVGSDDQRCDANVVAIAEDARGAVWIATRGLLDDRVGVLCRLEGGTFRVVERGDGWKEDFFGCMLGTRDGRLIVCSSSGLREIRGDRLKTYTRRDGLSSDFLLAAYEDADGALWIGTGGGGLNRLKDGVFASATTAQGLFDDTVFGIVEDDAGNLWLSCNRGIFRVSKRELDDLFAGRTKAIESIVYGVEHGMRSAECNGGSQYPAWRATDGRLWFATMKGAVVVDPRHLATNLLRPEVIVERFAADEQQRAIGAGLTLEPGSRALEFTYTATSLISSERVRFKYMMEGFDSDWIDAGTRRTAYYTNLPPGAYRFRVIAANSDGVWNDAGASVDFYLRPQFYQTWWFSLSCVALVLSLVLAAHRMRVRHMRSREKLLQQRVAQRTRQIAETESYSRAIVGNVGEGIVTFDGLGHISRWNAAAERIFAYSADEVIGKTAAILGIDDASDVNTAALPTVVVQARRKDGAVIPLEIHATAANSDRDSMTIWLVRDLTEARRAEAKVAAMQRELIATSRRAGMAQVATSVLHNVGNTLTSVNLSAHLVLDTLRGSRVLGLGKVLEVLPPDPEDLAVFLTATDKGRHLPAYLATLSDVIQGERQAAIQELESMGRGIEHIKAIVRAQQSNARVRGVDEWLALSELLDAALGFERSLCETAGVTVRKDYADMPPVCVDRNRLLEIVLNLLVNAREAVVDAAAPGARMITVRTRLVDDRTFAVDVRDTGVGIARDNLTRIFNLGFTTKPDGHGFGLHGSSCSAVELGGRLSADSDGPATGATFTLTLPIERPTDAAQAAAG